MFENIAKIALKVWL